MIVYSNFIHLWILSIQYLKFIQNILIDLNHSKPELLRRESSRVTSPRKLINDQLQPHNRLECAARLWRGLLATGIRSARLCLLRFDAKCRHLDSERHMRLPRKRCTYCRFRFSRFSFFWHMDWELTQIAPGNWNIQKIQLNYQHNTPYGEQLSWDYL